ncbi:MAG: alpha-E domain-containing protein [Rhodospirillaceae bacterium]|nr:alpha-E domain-containing protein [Rhodospirillaceae bacterium]
MLSRTADSLYWLARYIERADYLARILDAATRLAALPGASAHGVNEWESALASAGCLAAFRSRYAEANAATATAFVAFAEDNPSSIRQCLETARFNARAVRTAITSQMWETINGAWLDLHATDVGALAPSDHTQFLDWVKDVSLRFDGSAYRTMLREESYWFYRLGTFIERADNTARILDVKYHVLLPQTSTVGGGLDYSQWAAILRSVNALTAYHWVYRDSLKPWLIAEFLLLKPEMPRSLRSCYLNLVEALDLLAQHSGRQGPAQRRARAIALKLEQGRIDDIFASGLHEFVQTFLSDNNSLGAAISEQYLI